MKRIAIQGINCNINKIMAIGKIDEMLDTFNPAELLPFEWFGRTMCVPLFGRVELVPFP